VVLYSILQHSKNYNNKRIEELILAKIGLITGRQWPTIQTVRHLSFLMVQTRTITETV